MLAQQTLTIVALIAAIISMVLSCIALWPQWKQGLGIFRDLVLWAALAFVVFMFLNLRARSTVPNSGQLEKPYSPAAKQSFFSSPGDSSTSRYSGSYDASYEDGSNEWGAGSTRAGLTEPVRYDRFYQRDSVQR